MNMEKLNLFDELYVGKKIYKVEAVFNPISRKRFEMTDEEGNVWHRYSKPIYEVVIKEQEIVALIFRNTYMKCSDTVRPAMDEYIQMNCEFDSLIIFYKNEDDETLLDENFYYYDDVKDKIFMTLEEAEKKRKEMLMKIENLSIHVE